MPRLALRIAPNGSVRYQMAFTVQRPAHSCNLPSYLANSRRMRDVRSGELSAARFEPCCCVGLEVLSSMS